MEARKYVPNERNLVPEDPGVYCFYDKNNVVIYVGKAKCLKKRIASYFTSIKQHSLKTQKLVADIIGIECTLVNSEYEALLLESSLIKAHQPRYNILLKDGKTYPYLCITKERFPRVIATRSISPSSGQYYGPFTDTQAMYSLLTLIKQLYPLRTCTYKLSEENVNKKKFKVCLAYHLGNCRGPCAGLQTEQLYNQGINQIRHLLKGNLLPIKAYLTHQMHQSAKVLAYEEAQVWKNKLVALANYQAKSFVINPKFGDLDVFGMVSSERTAFISYFQVKGGAITFTQTARLNKHLKEKDSDLLPLVILNYREKYVSSAHEVLTNFPLTIVFDGLKVTVPKIGDKKKLVMLAVKNALFYKKEQMDKTPMRVQKEDQSLLSLQKDLRLAHLPSHIECFDNSNIQGSHPVAAMVCLKNGKPAKSEYRRFMIKTVLGANDFSSMYEVIHRRYTRLQQESRSLPDLIVVDGGKGQLSAAVEALKSVGIYGKVPIVGIAKRLEEIYYPEDPYPLHIHKKALALRLIQRIRNEAHRFALAFHRDRRSKQSFTTVLTTVPGIGPKTSAKLLTHFGSIKKMSGATLEELAAQVGNKKAWLLQKALRIHKP